MTDFGKMIGDRKKSGGLVYSTDSGRMCPACRKPIAQCICGSKERLPFSDGIARVTRQSKGRNGKTVTMISGLALEPAALSRLGKQLRTACGSGGTVKEGVIEVQGDHCERVIETLANHGLKAKRSGG
ncbi:MAG: translation initiation factor Sui1 [Betaproteobacteria bacterium]